METPGSTTVICTDKTGTLTQNKMAVHSLIIGYEDVNHEEPEGSAEEAAGQDSVSESGGIPASGETAVSGEGLPGPGWDPAKIPPVFLRVAGFCNNARFSERAPGYTGGPTEGALLVFANGFTSRTRFQSVFSKGLFKNRYVLAGIVSELLILSFIIWSPLAHLIFNTSTIDFKYLLLALPFALFLLAVDELRKYALRKNVGWVSRLFRW